MNISEELLKIARDLEASPKSVKAGVPFDLSLATKGGARLDGVIGLEFAERKRPSIQGRAVGLDYALKSDGWFRRISGAGKGYGLMIRSMTAGTKPVKTTEFFNVYRSTVTYLPDAHYNDDHPDKHKKAKMYVWVHRNYDISDVLGYVRSNLKKFVA